MALWVDSRKEGKTKLSLHSLSYKGSPFFVLISPQNMKACE